MIKTTGFIERFPVISFILLTFFISHVVNPILVEIAHIAFPGFSFNFPGAQLNERSLVAQYGPTIAGLLLTVRLYGFRGLRRIMRFSSVSRRTTGWLSVALLLPLGMIMLSYLFAGVSFQSLITTLFAHWHYYLLIIAGFVISAGLAEEFGWRGFLLPQLLKTTRPLMATFTIFIVLSLWHFPALLAGWKAEPILPWVILSLAIAIVHSWLFIQSGGNLWVVVLFHASFDAQYSFYSQFIPGASLANFPFHQGWAYVSLYCLLAMVIVILTNGKLGYDRVEWERHNYFGVNEAGQ